MRSIDGMSRRCWATIKVTAVALAATAALAACARAAVAASSSPMSRAAASPAAAAPKPLTASSSSGSIVVVRRANRRDSLWAISPTGSSAVKLINLPFRPARLLASPGDTKIAILPASVGGRVYIYYRQSAKLSPLSFVARGVKKIDGMTWLSSTRLLVSGSLRASRALFPLADRLYVINTTLGKPAAFRHLKGTEPSAAPGAKLLVYARLRDGGPVPGGGPGTRFVDESLIRLKLVAGSKPHVIAHGRYVNEPGRLFHDPDVSPDAKFVVTSTSESDTGVSYMVRYVASGRAVRTTRTSVSSRDVTAWSHADDKLAFWGIPSFDTDLYIYDTASKTLAHGAPMANMSVSGLAWAPDDSLVAYSVRAWNQDDDQGHLWTIGMGLSGTPTDLGPGSLPVWLP